jgi:hypothetical protein
MLSSGTAARGRSDAGEAHYAFLVKPGETIITGAGRRLRVLSVIPVDEPDSPYVGMLIEPS